MAERFATRLTALLLLFFALGCAFARSSETIVLAVPPYLPVEELVNRYRPLADFLGDRLETRVEVKVGRSYRDHLEQVRYGKVAIAVLGPAEYVLLSRTVPGLRPLARLEVEGSSVAKAAIVTRRDSGLRHVADLRGKRFAFGDEHSAATHFLPRLLLQEVDLGLEDLADFQFLGHHVNVVLGVLAGDFDAGGVSQEVFRQYENAGLQVLAWAPQLIENLIVAGREVAPERVERMRRVLLELGRGEDDKRVLERLRSGASALVPAGDSDYDDMREILARLGLAVVP